MPKITDKEEIEIVTDSGEKVQFNSTLELVKHMYGFMPRTPKNADISEDERDARWMSRHKKLKNQAR